MRNISFCPTNLKNLSKKLYFDHGKDTFDIFEKLTKQVARSQTVGRKSNEEVEARAASPVASVLPNKTIRQTVTGQPN